MTYRLREGLSFCWVDGHAIFLDIQSDRYFRLSDSVEAAFKTFMDGTNSEAESAALAKNNILTTAPATAGNGVDMSAMPAVRSVLEEPGPSRPLSLPVLLEVSVLVLATRRALRTGALADVMDRFVYSCRKNASHPPTLPVSRICEAANSFNRARLYVPVSTSCLLDSLSMARFLSRRQIVSSIVFGVTRDPFAAHCWVQAGDIVLNDTVGNVSAHTPIRIV